MTAIAWAIVLGAGLIAEAIEPGQITKESIQAGLFLMALVAICTVVEWNRKT